MQITMSGAADADADADANAITQIDNNQHFATLALLRSRPIVTPSR